MSKENELTPAEFLLFAGGNIDRITFLLGYVSDAIPADVRWHAAQARLHFEEQGATYAAALDLARHEVYDPRD